MSEAVSKQDIIKGDPFGEIEKEIASALGQMDKFDQGVKDLSSSLSGLNTSAKKTIQDINAVTEAEIKSERLLKQKLVTQQSEKNLLIANERLKQASLRTQKAENAVKEKTLSLYQQESRKLNDLRNAYKNLAVQNKENSKEAKALLAQIIPLDTRLKSIDKTVGQAQRNVGNYGGALDNLKGKFSSLIGLASQFGLALGGVAIVKGAIDTIRVYEDAIADLSAITGATGKDLEFFRTQSIEMGVNVKGGASAVVEAYKLIASAKPELLENAQALNAVTESAILLSKASGMELPAAATALTDAMNQFGAGAEQAGKFVDVLAAGAKFGSAEIPQITEALLKFGAVAKTSNVNIQESTGLIEALAERGLKGAEAGTALRNVMLKLSAPDALPKEAQDRLRALGVNFDELKDKSKPFSERLEALKPLLNDNAALIKVFGTENAVAATNLLTSTDRIKELTKSVDANGVALEQQNAKSKTLSEAFNRLKETWNGFILNLSNGTGAASGFTNALDFLARNLSTILSLIGKLLTTYVTYKVLTSDIVKNTVEWGKSMFGLSDATKVATDSTNKLGQSVKAIGFAGLLLLIQEVITRFYDLASGASRARFQMEQFEKANKKGSETAQKILDGIKEEGVARDAVIRKRIQQINLIRQEAFEEAKELKRKRDAMSANWQLTYTSQEYAAAVGVLNRKLIDKRALVGALTTTIDGLKNGLQTVGGAVDFVSDETNTYTESTDKANEATKKHKSEVVDLADDYYDLGAAIQELQDKIKADKQLGKDLLELPDFGDIDPNLPTVVGEEIDFKTDEEIAEERFEIFSNFQEALTQVLTDQIDARIALMKQEEDAAKSQQDYLMELAANGNITAKESIAEAIEVQREAQAEQIRLERIKQNIELISAGVGTFNSQLEAGKTPGEALASTIASTQVLVGFLKNIQFFAKGTDNAPEGLAVVDEKGGEIITDKHGKIKEVGSNKGARFTHLSKGDKVITASKSAEILNQFGNIQNGQQINRVQDVAGNSYDLLALDALGRIEKAVKTSQSKTDIHWDSFGVIQRTLKNGNIITNRYRMRP